MLNVFLKKIRLWQIMFLALFLSVGQVFALDAAQEIMIVRSVFDSPAFLENSNLTEDQEKDFVSREKIKNINLNDIYQSSYELNKNKKIYENYYLSKIGEDVGNFSDGVMSYFDHEKDLDIEKYKDAITNDDPCTDISISCKK